jgi:hypothetical protein
VAVTHPLLFLLLLKQVIVSDLLLIVIQFEVVLRPLSLGVDRPLPDRLSAFRRRSIVLQLFQRFFPKFDFEDT